MQAELKQDTERWYAAIQTAMSVSHIYMCIRDFTSTVHCETMLLIRAPIFRIT